MLNIKYIAPTFEKHWMKSILLVIFSLTLAACTQPSSTSSDSIGTNSTKQQPYILSDTHTETVTSTITGRNYRLFIRYPGGYFEADAQKTYPVVYLLDAQWAFPLLTSIAESLEYDKDIPQVIVVGITWQGSNQYIEEIRTLEFTPTENTDIKVATGGADQFIKVLKGIQRFSRC